MTLTCSERCSVVVTACPLLCRRLLGRDRLAAIEDSYCGICIIMLYFLYLTVTKGALSVFDCTINKSGAFLLDADPSIRCYEVPLHAQDSNFLESCVFNFKLMVLKLACLGSLTVGVLTTVEAIVVILCWYLSTAWA
jgi:hypothetical protein